MPARSAGGVWGRGERVEDDHQDAFEIRQHVVVPEAQHTKVICRKPTIPSLIFRGLRMLSAVHLDDKASLITREVCNIRTDRNLTAKFRTRKAAVAQRVPELALGRPSIACATGERDRSWPHRPPHPPRACGARHPLPRGERVSECAAPSRDNLPAGDSGQPKFVLVVAAPVADRTDGELGFIRIFERFSGPLSPCGRGVPARSAGGVRGG